jgi:hypothetical protein
MAVAVTALMAPIVGFRAGLLVFQRSLLWCRAPGPVLTCVDGARVDRARRSNRCPYRP